MKKIIAGLLILSMVFSLAACSAQTKFAEFQGTWVYSGDIYEKYIRIDGAQAYQGMISSAVDDEWSLGYELVKENGKFYILFSGGSKEEISVSSDGTKLNYDGRTYYKE